MFRFIHTSDVHLDTSFSGAGFSSHLGTRKREAIRGTFRRILEDARSEDADMILIAGDLFESERVTPDTVEFLRQEFGKVHPIPVFIAPGNHDPCMAGSPYREEPWPDNVHIFDREEFCPVELAGIGVRLAGFGYERPRLRDRLFATLPPMPGDLYNIVLCHGSDTGNLPAGKSGHGPFTIADIAGKNVQYCALGHYHRQHRLQNTIDGTEAWYPGIPEGRGWDETGRGGYLFGEFSGSALRVESRSCGQYPLQTMTVDCDGFTTREQILDAVLGRRGELWDSKTILRVRLEGAADPALDLSVAELGERLAGEALHVHWEDRTYPAWDFESIALEQTLRGRFVRELTGALQALAETPPADSDEKARLESARLYGVQALSGKEVKLR